MADCQYDWSTKTVPKLPTMLITPNMRPSEESISDEERQALVHDVCAAELVALIALVAFARVCVHNHYEDHEADHDDRGVDVRGEEGRLTRARRMLTVSVQVTNPVLTISTRKHIANSMYLQTAGKSVEYNAPGHEEGRKSFVDPRDGVHHGGTAQEQHGRDKDVCAEPKEHEDEVGFLAPAHVDELEKSVAIGRPALHFDRQDAEQEDLDRSARSVPERSGEAVRPGDIGRLQQSCRPCPL
eukprot:6195791-Pleurochrysis_carterae.AAC.2